MTILPVKKKREKDSGQRSAASSSAASSSDSSRQQQQGPSGSSSGSSAAKRSRHSEDGGSVRSSGLLSSTGVPIAAPVNVSPPARNSQSSISEIPAASNPPPPPSVPKERGEGDCNSDDEYEGADPRDEALEADFEERMGRRGFVIKEMEGDGACMFRAIAEQIYGDQEMHGQIRDLCMDYMAGNKDHFKEFITEDYEGYIERKRDERVHGNHIELQAISEIFARPVEVYQYSDEPINILMPRVELAAPADGAGPSNAAAAQMQQNPPIRLSYHRNVHYNALLTPNVPTIGVGLGLPGMVPGAADKDLMSKAMATSELEHIEETMLQDKIGMTDYQRTQADIEDQIARESLMSYLNDLGKSRQESAAAPGPSTSFGEQSTSSAPRSDDFGGFGRATSSAGGGMSSGAAGASSGSGLYEELLAAQSIVPDWDAYTDDVAIAEAMLVSQQDFISQMPGSSGGGGPRNDYPDDRGPSSSSGSGSK